jgi:hypothetical protein
VRGAMEKVNNELRAKEKKKNRWIKKKKKKRRAEHNCGLRLEGEKLYIIAIV